MWRRRVLLLTVAALGVWPVRAALAPVDQGIARSVFRDPGEAYNVAETHPERARELREILEQWRVSFRENPRGWR